MLIFLLFGNFILFIFKKGLQSFHFCGKMNWDVIKMKKLHFLVLALLCIVFFCSCGVKKVDSLQREKKDFPKRELSEREAGIKDSKIKVGIDESGFSEDFVRAFSKESGIDVETVRFGTFEDVRKAIENEEIQMYLGNFPKESKETIDFCVSAPYLKETASVLALSEDYIRNKETDIGGYIKNTAEEMLVENYFSNSKGYDNLDSLMNALSKKEVDCAFVNTSVFKKSGYFGQRYFEIDSCSYSLVAVFNQKDGELAKEADVFLAKLKASGEADDISEKYFGESLIVK